MMHKINEHMQLIHFTKKRVIPTNHAQHSSHSGVALRMHTQVVSGGEGGGIEKGDGRGGMGLETKCD